jgi:hypothetical protein
MLMETFGNVLRVVDCLSVGENAPPAEDRIDEREEQ